MNLEYEYLGNAGSGRDFGETAVSKEMNQLLADFELRSIAVKDKIFAPALEAARSLLDQYTGVTNKINRVFAYDLCVVDDHRPYAICADHCSRFCIIVWAGVLARIAEVAITLVDLYSSALEKTQLRARFKHPAGYNFLLDASPQDKQLSSLPANTLLEGSIQGVFDEGRGQLFAYVTNQLLLFFLFHEIQHAVAGHAAFLKSLGISYIGESESDLSSTKSKAVQFLCELEADVSGLRTLIEDFALGEERFIVPGVNTFWSTKEPQADTLHHTGQRILTIEERLTIIWTGVLMLANCWVLSEPFEQSESTHPLALDRFVNLYWGVERFRKGSARGRALVEKCRHPVENCALTLARCHSGYLPLGATFIDAGRERCRKMYRRYTKGNRAQFQAAMTNHGFRLRSA